MGRVLGTASVLVSTGDQRHAPDSTAEAGQTALIPGPLGTRKRTANQLHGSVTWDQARSGKYLLYHSGTWVSQVHSGHDNELGILAYGVVPRTPASGVRHLRNSERRSPPPRRPTLRTFDNGLSSACETYNPPGEVQRSARIRTLDPCQAECSGAMATASPPLSVIPLAGLRLTRVLLMMFRSGPLASSPSQRSTTMRVVCCTDCMLRRTAPARQGGPFLKVRPQPLSSAPFFQ